MRHVVMHGDCLEVLKTLPDNSVDSVVTDPPYGLTFMGREWDSFAPRAFQQWVEKWARECLRVLKPGGHLAAFGGSRTEHRLTCGIEDAGFEIRDKLQWLYGSGFPKSLDVSKAIDAKMGAERELNGEGERETNNTLAGGVLKNRCPTCDKPFFSGNPCSCPKPEPTTPEAAEWEGWGTALKPAYEPIVLARKPFNATVAENVLKHGTAGLNIDGCRVPTDDTESLSRHNGLRSNVQTYNSGVWQEGTFGSGDAAGGRWPANVVLSCECEGDEHDPDCPVRLLDEQSGEGILRKGVPRGAASGDGWGMTATGAEYNDSGGASRFFYCAKASVGEREFGLGPDFESRYVDEGRAEGSDGRNSPRAGAGRQSKRRNRHPTVKPIPLMRWLIRLITPPGGTVLDPFTGSGSTGIAAVWEDMGFLGIELNDTDEEPFASIARARIEYAKTVKPSDLHYRPARKDPVVENQQTGFDF